MQDPDYGNLDSKNVQECKKFNSIIKTLSDMMETWIFNLPKGVSQVTREQSLENKSWRCTDAWWMSTDQLASCSKDGFVWAANIGASTGWTNHSILKFYPLEVTGSEAPAKNDLQDDQRQLSLA